MGGMESAEQIAPFPRRGDRHPAAALAIWRGMSTSRTDPGGAGGGSACAPPRAAAARRCFATGRRSSARQVTQTWRMALEPAMRPPRRLTGAGAGPVIRAPRHVTRMPRHPARHRGTAPMAGLLARGSVASRRPSRCVAPSGYWRAALRLQLRGQPRRWGSPAPRSLLTPRSLAARGPSRSDVEGWDRPCQR